MTRNKTEQDDSAESDDDHILGAGEYLEEYNLLELPPEEHHDGMETVQGDHVGEDEQELDYNDDTMLDENGWNDNVDDTERDMLQKELIDGGEEAASEAVHHTYPEERETLVKQLLGMYKCPDVAPYGLGQQQHLTKSEELSLQHYIAWRQSNGTELAYKCHSSVLQKATQTKLLSLHAVKKLASKLSGIKANKYDVCPNSCMAYTGEHAAKSRCCFTKNNEICNESRFNKKGKPWSQMVYVSCFDMIRAMYANAETSYMLRNCDRSLQRALHLLGQAKETLRTYSDFGDSDVQVHLHKHVKLFKDPQDVAFALSTDGAQLTMKKQSNTWVAVLILLNLAAEI